MVELLKRAIITEWQKYHSISLTVASTSGRPIVVLNVLWRMTVVMHVEHCNLAWITAFI